MKYKSDFTRMNQSEIRLEERKPHLKSSLIEKEPNLGTPRFWFLMNGCWQDRER